MKAGVSDTSIVIPETIDGMPVVAIGARAFRLTSIVDIRIGGNIRRIEDEAFSHCDKLISVKWNCKCNAVPAYCFYGCTNLKHFDFSEIKKVERYAFMKSGLQEVCLPENIEVVEEETFRECRGLRSVTWNCTCDVIPANCFFECSNLTHFDFSAIKKIEKYSFSRSGLQEVSFPENIKIIEEGTFKECSGLRSVAWNCTCDVIPALCFYMCPNLTNFDFSSIKKVGQYAFVESGLQEVCLQKNIEILEDGTFSRCNGLRSVTWNCTCDVIPNFCFAVCSNLTNFDFSGIKKIGKYAFKESGLQEVWLSESIKNIEEGTFKECSGLRSVTWNCTCDVIPASCFAFCSNLTQFDLSGIKKVGTSAFVKSGLTSVTLSKGTTVNQNCFAFCKSLAKVEWLSARSIKGDIFKGCEDIKEIFISDNVKNIEASAFASSPNAEITFI